MKQMCDLLVVDDDAALNGVLCQFLRKNGYTVGSALDGNAALNALEKHVPSLVLLDVMLPDSTGIDICEKIKLNRKTGGVPVVVVTALCDDETRWKAMACGAAAFVTKPFDVDELLGMVRKYVLFDSSTDNAT